MISTSPINHKSETSSLSAKNTQGQMIKLDKPTICSYINSENIPELEIFISVATKLLEFQFLLISNRQEDFWSSESITSLELPENLFIIHKENNISSLVKLINLFVFLGDDIKNEDFKNDLVNLIVPRLYFDWEGKRHNKLSDSCNYLISKKPNTELLLLFIQRFFDQSNYNSIKNNEFNPALQICKRSSLAASDNKENLTKEKTNLDYASQGADLKKQGDIVGAIHNYYQAIQSNFQQPIWVYSSLVECLELNNQFIKAIEVSSQGINLYTQAQKLYRLRGVAHARLNNRLEVISNYQQAITLESDQPHWVYYVLADYYFLQKKIDESIQVAAMGLEKYPDKGDLHRILGVNYCHRNYTDKVIDHYQQAINLEPNQPLWLYKTLGNYLEEKGHNKEALSIYLKVIEIDDVQPASFYEKVIIIAAKVNELEVGTDLGKKALEIYPRSYAIHKAIETIIPQQNILKAKDENTVERINYLPNQSDNALIRLIAFFLPQYHPIPENDEWWGKGFTEWRNVTKAKPLFEGHSQPRLPADLGFYDLRLPEVRDAQAKLAKKYGIYGFCYYYYWFAGKRLLDRPIDEILHSKHPDFPFCLCWANENWTRRWDGSENEILIAQEHSLENNKAFAESLVPFMKDERYIRINEKPLVLIYRANILPDIEETVKLWRDIWRENGVGEVYLCGCLGFQQQASQLISWGFDAGVEFPPHYMGTESDLIDPASLGANDFKGHLFDCRPIVKRSLKNKLPSEKKFLSVMVSWDNTARRGKQAHVFLNNDPEMYELWLSGVIEKTKQIHSGNEQLVFINAWNEWAEGTYLEPDTKYGHSYLSATSRALNEAYSWQTSINLIRYLPIQTEEHLNHLLDELQLRIESLQRSIEVLIKEVSQKKIGYSLSVSNIQYKNQDRNTIYFDSPTLNTKVNSNEHLSVSGWCFNSRGEKVKKIRICRNQSIVLADIDVYINRPDIGQVYPQCQQLDVGFTAWIRVEYLLASEPDHTLQVFSVLESGQAVESADLDISIKKEQEIQKKVSGKLKTKIKSYYAQKEEVTSIIPQIRLGKQSNNFDDLLDELEEIVKQWQAIPTEFEVYID